MFRIGAQIFGAMLHNSDGFCLLKQVVAREDGNLGFREFVNRIAHNIGGRLVRCLASRCNMARCFFESRIVILPSVAIQTPPSDSISFLSDSGKFLISAEFLDQPLVNLKCRFRRVIALHNAELIKQSWIRAIGIAETE